MKKIYVLFLLTSSLCAAQTINFTIDTAVDNGTSITETIVEGSDTYILTILHPGNEELDNLGAGDMVFYLSGIDPLEPYVLSITKNDNSINFTLLGIDYDTLATGSISIQNQNDDEISANTEYVVGSGAIAISNTTNATNISSFKITPTGVLDLNNFGFHNINVDVGTTLSSSELLTEALFKYYPNPVESELKLVAKTRISNMTIFNVLGEMVITDMPNALTTKIDMSNLQPGVYFIELSMVDTIKTIRVIKQ